MFTSTAILQLCILAVVIILATVVVVLILGSRQAEQRKLLEGIHPSFLAMLSDKELRHLEECAKIHNELSPEELQDEVLQAQIWDAAVERQYDEEEAYILNKRIDKARAFEVWFKSPEGKECWHEHYNDYIHDDPSGGNLGELEDSVTNSCHEDFEETYATREQILVDGWARGFNTDQVIRMAANMCFTVTEEEIAIAYAKLEKAFIANNQCDLFELIKT